MSSETIAWIEDFNTKIEGVAKLLNITAGSEIQIDAIGLLDDVLLSLKERKRSAIQSESEDVANAVLGCECVARALRCELQMWLSLKKEDPHAAWDFLIAAQLASMDAARAHSGLEHWAQHHERLSLIQNLVYPKQVFMSPGGEVVDARCSICDAEYGGCDHIRGRPYMGEFCHRKIYRMKLTEVSVVEEPANRLCRVIEMDLDGKRRDTLTWRVVQTTDSTPPE
ncbi:MAG: hypothetical protein F4023_08605 [Acidobacteria bacterium]|nr:hypothetical protein [Acidobacteriota bacterium]MYH20766.1 hypothetical protein [Acidobacteriota bacterium]MYK79696.1 hypothetical protein [Acidobacteriota bacterium]